MSIFRIWYCLYVFEKRFWGYWHLKFKKFFRFLPVQHFLGYFWLLLYFMQYLQNCPLKPINHSTLWKSSMRSFKWTQWIYLNMHVFLLTSGETTKKKKKEIVIFLHFLRLLLPKALIKNHHNLHKTKLDQVYFKNNKKWYFEMTPHEEICNQKWQKFYFFVIYAWNYVWNYVMYEIFREAQEITWYEF